MPVVYHPILSKYLYQSFILEDWIKVFIISKEFLLSPPNKYINVNKIKMKSITSQKCQYFVYILSSLRGNGKSYKTLKFS